MLNLDKEDKKTISTRFKNCSATSTIGQREKIDNENKYRDFVFYPVIDYILVEMNDRFSKSNMEILRGTLSLSPDSSTFFEVEKLTDLCIMLQCDIVSLPNEIQFTITATSISPTIIYLPISAMSILVSSTGLPPDEV
ncbi:unnamed protein product [Rotaria socialis]|uniref:Uncharacterized protein n=2 Tax=Rotaria socialis TaxID=392032 RepID=A0A821KSG9_9BILA|nr:unnamed protein product [Rotaria socialis]CAF3387999.1 unnamed protein product [Rotaria socialis]CAF3488960.1 unnamed protein product [Rotaria socialis]CAF4392869.1 unnamed protein product [Rotaria socialis]CAF4505289.1 unnamed protein product [Rotaria socialis]